MAILHAVARDLFFDTVGVVIRISRVFAARALLVHNAAQYTASRLCQERLHLLEVLLVSVSDIDHHEYSIHLGRKNVRI